MKHTVSESTTLIEALALFYPDSSKRTLLQWIKFGRIVVGGKVVKRGDLSIEKGCVVEINEKKEILYFRGMKILYQDRWMVVIDKPSGLLSVASENAEAPHALQHLREYLATPALFAVHRIDRETSGVLLFARGKEAEERFDQLFEQHDIIREYIAIVEGRIPEDQGTWRSYLQEKENYDVVTTSPESGKLAITHYHVFRRSKKFSYLSLRLETGRKHQIRVHCLEAGYPILGDKRYGSMCNPAKRLCLHATLLKFIHPFTGKEVSFSSPAPKAFSALGL